MKKLVSYFLIFIFSLNSILNFSYTNNTNSVEAAEVSSQTAIDENASASAIEENNKNDENTDKEDKDSSKKTNLSIQSDDNNPSSNPSSDNDNNASQTSIDEDTTSGTSIEEDKYDIEFTQEELTKTEDSFYTSLQNAFNIAKEEASDDKPFKIYIPKGTYTLSNMLKIYSNTSLILDSNAKIITAGSDENSMRIMLVNGNYIGSTVEDDEYSGYGSYKNITIEGGIWDGNSKNYSGTNKPILFRFAHAKNLTIKNAVFQNNKGNHHIEAAAIDGFNVENCTFKETSPNYDGTDTYLEALQIDITTPSYPAFISNTDSQKNDGSGYDNVPCKNVTVSGCSFQNVFRGIGTHHPGINELPDSDVYYENITIENNKFYNVSDANIIGQLWKNAIVRNNTIAEKTTLKKSGITMYYCVDSIIEKNTIYNCEDQAIIVNNGSAKSVSGNKVYYSHNYGIYIYKADVENVNSNTITGCQSQGLRIFNSTIENNIYKNTISKCQAQGIDITNSTIKKSITDNTVQNNQITQITINTQNNESSSAFSIIRNKISGGSYGLVVGENTKVDYIYGNEINENYQNGISLNNCQVGSVGVEKSENKISGSGNIGISVTNESSIDNVLNNSITSSGNVSLSLSNETKVKNINSNTITTSGNAGILVTNGANADNISNNIIINPAANGISLNESNSKVNQITSNNIKDAGNHGISIIKPAIVTGAISDNTIIKTGDTGIYTNSSIANGINNNTITSPSRQGIKTINANTLSIDDNRITGGTVGIYSEGGNIKSYNNNNISSSIGSGIIIKNISTIQDLNTNYIDNTEQDSLYLLGTTIENPIKNNTIKNSKKNGIYLEASTVSLEDNTISSSKFQSIYSLNSTIDNISNNKFTGSLNAIYLNKGTISKINSNTITSTDESAILVTDITSISQINSNYIKNPGTNGIYLYASKAKTIKNNEIKKAEQHGIFISQSQVDSFKKNTIQQAEKNGIYINKSTISKMTSNTVKKAMNVGYAITNSSSVLYTTANKCSSSTLNISLSKNSRGLFFINQTTIKALAQYPFNASTPTYSKTAGKIVITQKKEANQKSYLKTQKNGQIILKKDGTATLLYSQNGCSTIQKVNVTPAPQKVYVKKKKLKLVQGKTYTIKPWVNKKATCPKYTFKTSKKKIATVSKKGIIKAKAKGKTTITVKTYNGKKVKIKVTIKAKK